MVSLYETLKWILGASFIGTPYRRKLTNIFGEKLKLVLVWSEDLVDLLEPQEYASVYYCFADIPFIISKVGYHIDILNIQHAGD